MSKKNKKKVKKFFNLSNTEQQMLLEEFDALQKGEMSATDVGQFMNEEKLSLSLFGKAIEEGLKQKYSNNVDSSGQSESMKVNPFVSFSKVKIWFEYGILNIDDGYRTLGIYLENIIELMLEYKNIPIFYKNYEENEKIGINGLVLTIFYFILFHQKPAFILTERELGIVFDGVASIDKKFVLISIEMLDDIDKVILVYEFDTIPWNSILPDEIYSYTDEILDEKNEETDERRDKYITLAYYLAIASIVDHNTISYDIMNFESFEKLFNQRAKIEEFRQYILNHENTIMIDDDHESNIGLVSAEWIVNEVVSILVSLVNSTNEMNKNNENESDEENHDQPITNRTIISSPSEDEENVTSDSIPEEEILASRTGFNYDEAEEEEDEQIMAALNIPKLTLPTEQFDALEEAQKAIIQKYKEEDEQNEEINESPSTPIPSSGDMVIPVIHRKKKE